MTDTAIGAHTPPAATRHPLDPEPVRSTKAAAVLALGIAAVITGPFVGGLIPAALGLVLARQASDDLVASRGYLTGARHVRTGRTLAWVGIALAIAAIVVASIVGILSLAANVGHDFPDTSN